MAVESAADRASFFADFGAVDVDGLPMLRWTSGAVTSRVAGHLHQGTVTLDVEEGAGLVGRRATFHCALEAVPSGASPGNAVSYDGTAFTVKSIEPDGTGLMVVLLEEVVED